jgi:uncharacterized membrane-anchored protein YhcB (DUF1043 family)
MIWVWIACALLAGYVIGRFSVRFDLINMSMVCWQLQGEAECSKLENQQLTIKVKELTSLVYDMVDCMNGNITEDTIASNVRSIQP